MQINYDSLLCYNFILQTKLQFIKEQIPLILIICSVALTWFPLKTNDNDSMSNSGTINQLGIALLTK